MASDDLAVYYNRGREQSRLFGANGQLEMARTQEIVRRYLRTMEGDPAMLGATGHLMTVGRKG